MSQNSQNQIPGEGLNPKQETVALALATGSTRAEAAKKARVGLSTVQQWWAQCPELRVRIQEIRADISQQAIGQFIDGIVGAVTRMRYLYDNAESEAVQLGAAKSIIEAFAKFRDSVELEERVARLEARRRGK